MTTPEKLTIRYCSHPDGHAPKDCPDLEPAYTTGLEQLAHLEAEDLAAELEAERAGERLPEARGWR